MNIGFFLGFTVAGIFQSEHSYNILFLLTTITNIIAFIFLSIGWKSVADKSTPLVRRINTLGNSIVFRNILITMVIIIVTIAILFAALQHPLNTNYIALGIGILLLAMFYPIAKVQSTKVQRDKVYAYIILAIFGR